MPNSTKAMLIILDGWGLSPNKTGNAPLLAKTPVLDYVYSTYPKTSISASGLEVGLGVGEPGNSEVGHTNIGSGRIAWENLPRIDQDIESGNFFDNEVLNEAIENAKKNKTALHLIGLVSDGGVHSHIRHLITLLEAAKKKGLDRVYIHGILDGRDTAPKVAKQFLDQLEDATKHFGGKLLDLVGRYFAMDRDKNWDREKKAFDLFVNGAGTQYNSYDEAIEANYKNGKSDEDFEPSVIGEHVNIQEKDSVIFFNHRSDRSRQMLQLFCGKEGGKVPTGLFVVSMTEYEKGQSAAIMFPPINLGNTLCDVIAKAGMTQFHTAETEKYAHVTYFLKAGVEELEKGEKDKVVPSKKVPSYAKIPEMSAFEVTDVLKKAIDDDYDFIVVNYANGDMVGHTGDLNAAIKACEDIDQCLLQVFTEASTKGYKVFVTADHGNCEVMLNELTGEPDKEHSTNPVPFVFLDFTKTPFDFHEVEFSDDDYIQFASNPPIGVLADIAPSIIEILGLDKPKEMSGMDLSSAMG